MLTRAGVILLLLSPTAIAQQAILGTVTDTSGAAVPGASVAVVNAGTNAVFHANTSQQGFYTVPGIPPRPFMAPPEAHGDEYVGIFADEVWAGVDDGKEA